MNRKAVIALSTVVVAIITAIAFGRSRAARDESRTESPTVAVEGDDSGTIRENGARGDDSSFAPLAPDPNADATTRDVLIAAVNARQSPALAEGRWYNSEPTTMERLRGKVVLVDFWTFGCYNCINTLPALKSYDAKFRDKGLTIVGVETPEFDSEKNPANLQRSIAKHGIKYPIVTDYDGETWRAFNVEAWPTIIILDKQGRIRYTHIGEGAYDVQERVITTLLDE